MKYIIPLNIKFTFDDKFIISSLFRKTHGLEIGKRTIIPFIEKYNESIATECCDKNMNIIKKK